MDSLFENSLARMYGPDFIVVYLVLYLFALLFMRYGASERAGKIKDEETTQIPLRPDPYELAYLRGFEPEIVALAIYTVIDRKYFSIYTDKLTQSIGLMKNSSRKDSFVLSPIEKTVFNKLHKATSILLFSNNLLRDEDFLVHCQSIERKLISEQLILDAKEKRKFYLLKTSVITVLALFGLYKIIAAVYHGHSNILFIILIGFIGTLLLSGASVSIGPTSKGLKLLHTMRQTFKPVRGNILLKQALYLQQLLLGIHGFQLLNSTSLSNLYTDITKRTVDSFTIFRKNSDTGSSGLGSGSSCSSGGGGCSSSGCGSSCGGGCGGGCGGCS